jgi:hypothetical protein
MLFWQPIAAAVLLLLALAYVSRRAWLRLSSLKPSKRLRVSCAGEACCGCAPVHGSEVSTARGSGWAPVDGTGQYHPR